VHPHASVSATTAALATLTRFATDSTTMNLPIASEFQQA
jgi:hypothetical protein